MTIANAISALSALNADALKTASDAMLERLRELADDCLTLIAEEEERRNPPEPEPEHDMEAIVEHFSVKRMEAHRARRVMLKKEAEERRAVLREVIDYCGANPDLQARIKAVLEHLREED